MSTPLDRRNFLSRSLSAGAIAAGAGDFAFLGGLPTLAADQARVNPRVVQFSPETEPLVRLIEDTPRPKLMERLVEQVRQGTTYQQLLAAVFLAGVRGIQPRPVGFKFHAVLVINSAHLASLAAPDQDRWLPLFWSADNFKASQARNKAEGDWHMAPVAEDKLPPAHQARQRFTEAMDNWDVEAADRAIVSLVRSAGAAEVIELFWRYGSRDFRDIGHKAIYAANGWRALQAVGWRHAEPVLRSLAYALLEHEGSNPAKRDDVRDRSFRQNLVKVKGMKPLDETEARAGGADAGREVLEVLRSATPDEACDRVVELMGKGVGPAQVWDGLFLMAGELLMRQPGIVGLHCVTSANALHYAYQTSANDETRRLLMLQTAAFLPLFREAMKGRGKLGDVRIDKLEPAPVAKDTPAAVEEVFATVSRDKMQAARQTLTLLSGEPTRVTPLMHAARRLIFSKGRDSHDYKFSSAALEDYYHLTPAWRARYAAASMFNLRGAGDRDNDLIRRTRAALNG